jgi:chromosome segregation ATPase
VSDAAELRKMLAEANERVALLSDPSKWVTRDLRPVSAERLAPELAQAKERAEVLTRAVDAVARLEALLGAANKRADGLADKIADAREAIETLAKKVEDEAHGCCGCCSDDDCGALSESTVMTLKYARLLAKTL